MSAVTKWILSIFVAVIIGVVVDLLFSGSRMSKMIRCVTATVTLVIIVMPLPSMIKSGFGAGETVFEYNPQTDEHFLSYVTDKKLEVLADSVEDMLEKEGISGANVTIDAEKEGDEINIVQVVINLSNSVIDENLQHINKNELATDKTVEYLGVDKSRIVVYG